MGTFALTRIRSPNWLTPAARLAPSTGRPTRMTERAAMTSGGSSATRGSRSTRETPEAAAPRHEPPYSASTMSYTLDIVLADILGEHDVEGVGAVRQQGRDEERRGEHQH